MTSSRRGACAAAALAAFVACNDSSWTPILGYFGPVGYIYVDTTTLSVPGVRFAPGAVASWNGRPQATTFISDKQLMVGLDLALIAPGGTGSLTVSNPGGYPSPAAQFRILGRRPKLTTINPAFVQVGSPDFTLTATGAAFTLDSALNWNGTVLRTTFVSTTELTAIVPAALAAQAGSGAVTVSSVCDADVLSPCTSGSLVCAVDLAGAAGVTVLSQEAKDLLWDGARGLLYLSVPDSAAHNPGTISAVSLTSGGVVASAAAAKPSLLSATDDGQFLYYVSGDPNQLAPLQLARVGLPALAGLQSWSLPTLLQFDEIDLQAAPGAPRAVALTTGFALLILDDGVARPTPSATAQTFTNAVQWGSDATRLFAASSDFYAFSVDAAGAALTRTVPGVFSNSTGGRARIHLDKTTQHIYADQGQDVDQQGSSGQLFKLPGGSFDECKAAPDGANGKIYFACAEGIFGGTLMLHSFDIATHNPIARVLLHVLASDSDPREYPVHLVRWGPNGLALVTNQDRVYLYAGAFVH